MDGPRHAAAAAASCSAGACAGAAAARGSGGWCRGGRRCAHPTPRCGARLGTGTCGVIRATGQLETGAAQERQGRADCGSESPPPQSPGCWRQPLRARQATSGAAIIQELWLGGNKRRRGTHKLKRAGHGARGAAAARLAGPTSAPDQADAVAAPQALLQSPLALALTGPSVALALRPP